MNYLLDTCLLSELRKPEPDAGVVAWVSDVDERRLFVSVLSLGAIQKEVGGWPSQECVSTLARTGFAGPL